MLRFSATFSTWIVLAAWAGAQGPPLTAAVELQLLRENRTLLNDLVNQGVALSGTDDLVGRTEKCAETVRTLGAAIRRAAEAQNPDRIAELGGHLNGVVQDALIPNLDEGRRTIDPSSPEAIRLEDIRGRAAGNLDELRDALPSNGTLGDNAKVQQLRQTLAELKLRIKSK